MTAAVQTATGTSVLAPAGPSAPSGTPTSLAARQAGGVAATVAGQAAAAGTGRTYRAEARIRATAEAGGRRGGDHHYHYATSVAPSFADM